MIQIYLKNSQLPKLRGKVFTLPSFKNVPQLVLNFIIFFKNALNISIIEKFLTNLLMFGYGCKGKMSKIL